jgi:hypothetical protein
MDVMLYLADLSGRRRRQTSKTTACLDVHFKYGTETARKDIIKATELKNINQSINREKYFREKNLTVIPVTRPKDLHDIQSKSSTAGAICVCLFCNPSDNGISRRRFQNIHKAHKGLMKTSHLIFYEIKVTISERCTNLSQTSTIFGSIGDIVEEVLQESLNDVDTVLVFREFLDQR